LSRVILPELLRVPRHGREEEDRVELADLVKTLWFCTRDGRLRPAVDLLIGASDQSEESMRARFAPDDRVLAPDYRGAGLEFFRACRPGQQMWAGVELLASWAVEATNTPCRMAVLDYLAGSYDLSGKLADLLYRDVRDHWLNHLNLDSGLLRHHDARHRGILLSQLGLLTTPEPPKPLPAFRPDPRQVLAALHDRWMAQGAAETARYEQVTYPDGGRPHWAVDGLAHDEEARRGWFILLALGAMHTQGRTRPWQDTGFLRLCRDRHWLDTFSRPPGNPDDWIGVLEDYLGNQVEKTTYFHWMRHFVGFYQLSHWLVEYAELFLSFNRRLKPFSLAPLLASRADPTSPADAPPLSSVLRTGACFVVRELARSGIIDPTQNSQIHPHCYVPARRVRFLLTELGCAGLDESPRGLDDRLAQSQTIHRFLCRHLDPNRAHIDFAFDLPLLALADNPEWRHDLLGDTGGWVEFGEVDDREDEPW